MPTYRSITISLVSQFDILTIPEYAPPSTSIDPFSQTPVLVDPNQSLVSVYVPTYPSSQFWLSYSISPPHPPHALFYFKLFLNDSHVVSWGCGEEEEFKGRAMFGLYCAGESRLGKSGIEKRVFCFAGEDYGDGQLRGNRDRLGDVMEVKVYRAKGRKRIWPELVELKEPTKKGTGQKRAAQRSSGSGVDLINAGTLEDKHPKRFYRYALLDPTDQPFASFRYYYRTWDQLEALGVTSPSPDESRHDDDNDDDSLRTSTTRTPTSLSSHHPSPTDQRLFTADNDAEPDDAEKAQPTRMNPTPTPTPTPSISISRHQSPIKPSPVPSPSPSPSPHPPSSNETTSLHTAPSTTSRATLTPPPTALFPLPLPISNSDPALTHSPTIHASASTRTPAADAGSSPSRFGRLLKTPSPTKGKENRSASGGGSGSATRDGRAGLLFGVVASAVRRKGAAARGVSTPTPTKGLE